MTPERWRRAQEVFLAATEREQSLRPAFLDEACRDDPELRVEVESLLSTYREAPSSFLESPAIEGIPAIPLPAVRTRSIGKGARLGPYEILASLGSGGMGEVYRARDPRLDRDVAIKVLPAEWSTDTSRVKRFEKEARSASALNHPNIVTVYDTGSSDGVTWIAMERVDGATIRELLAGGPLAIRRLLPIATQIADGLAKAHEAGIVHRDLKPENVMVTRDGLVKILDFGLAKLSSTGSGSGEGSNLPTMTGTTPGVVVGTVGYMSPEQASGEPLDFRSDQFSFGSILYEMLTGKRAFQGKTAIDILGAILNSEPPSIASVNPQAPAPLRWIAERCLSKEARQRYSSTDDLARDLANLRDHLSEATMSGVVAPAGESKRSRTLPLVATVAGMLALLAVGVFSGRWLGSRNVTMAVPSFHRLTFRRGNVFSARFTPDGAVVYAAAWDGAPMEVFTVRKDSIESRAVGLPRANVSSVSSKGELAVLLEKPGRRGTLARVPLEGGTPREVLEDVTDASWAPNGEDLAVRVQHDADGIVHLEYPIGTVLAERDWFVWIRVSPKGDLVAYCGKGEKGSWAIKTVDRKGKVRIVSDGWQTFDGLAWSAGGDEIVFEASRSGGFAEHAIRAVSLSGRERVLISNAHTLILNDVGPDGRLLVENSAARGGILCQPRGETRERELGRLDQSTVRAISPDGKLVAFAETGEAADSGVYLRKSDGSPAVRLGNASLISDISSDGQWVFCIDRGPPPQALLIPTGPGITKRVTLDGNPAAQGLLPDGKEFFVAYKAKDGTTTNYIVGFDGGKPRRIRPDLDADVVTLDGVHLTYFGNYGQIMTGLVSGGPDKAVPGARIEPNDEPVGDLAVGRFLYLWHKGEVPALVDRVDLETGKREPWKRLMPEDPAGILRINPVILADEGRSYAYSYVRVLVSDLYVVDGAR